MLRELNLDCNAAPSFIDASSKLHHVSRTITASDGWFTYTLIKVQLVGLGQGQVRQDHDTTYVP
jgi:hypothetical protein